MLRCLTSFTTIAALLLGASAAHAHVVIEPGEAPPAAYVKLVFRVSHGCNGSPTRRLVIRMPDGLVSVRPQPKPGWELDIRRVPLAVPLDGGHGKKIGEAVSEVIWSGGKLADEHFDEFALSVRTPDRAGTTLHFPVLQECEQGVLNWTDLPSPGKSARELQHPAPSLRLAPRAVR